MEGVCTNASYDLVSTVACKVKVAAPSHTIKTVTTGSGEGEERRGAALGAGPGTAPLTSAL